MIRTMYVVSPHDTVHQPFVLRHMGERRLVVMDQYRDLVCPRCGKVNEKAALERGIQPEVVVKSKRPLVPSLDDFYLVNERGRQVFSALLPDEIAYHRIPSSDYYVASAKTWQEPGETDPGYRFIGGRCKGCGRVREVYWSKTPPRLAEGKRFVCINMEGKQGARETWFVSKELAAELEKASPPLTGVVLVPKEVDDGRSVQEADQGGADEGTE